MANRDRGSTSGSRSRLTEGLRNTEIKRETDIRNSMGPSEETEREDETMKRPASSEREKTRGRSGEEPE